MHITEFLKDIASWFAIGVMSLAVFLIVGLGIFVFSLNSKLDHERAALQHERKMKNREIQRLEAENRGLVAENRKLRLEYDRLAEVNY